MDLSTLGGIVSIGSSLYGLYKGNQTQNMAQQAFGASDPFGPYRAQYAQQLGALLQDPSSVTKEPGYQFQFEQGQQAVERSMAAKGFVGSGNAAIALTQYGQEFAHNWFMDEAKFLAQLSGAGITPNFGPALSGMNAGINQAGNSLASLGYTLGNPNSSGSQLLNNIFGGNTATIPATSGDIGTGGSGVVATTLPEAGGAGVASGAAGDALGATTAAGGDATAGGLAGAGLSAGGAGISTGGAASTLPELGGVTEGLTGAGGAAATGATGETAGSTIGAASADVASGATTLSEAVGSMLSTAGPVAAIALIGVSFVKAAIQESAGNLQGNTNRDFGQFSNTGDPATLQQWIYDAAQAGPTNGGITQEQANAMIKSIDWQDSSLFGPNGKFATDFRATLAAVTANQRNIGNQGLSPGGGSTEPDVSNVYIPPDTGLGG